MTSYVENETDSTFPFDVEDTVKKVMEAVLETEECPFETEINVLLTDNSGIQTFNAAHRNIDAPTDVLSFPNLAYETPSDFEEAAREEADCFNPESGELLLGDIIISVDKVKEQAEEYGHSQLREFAFLVAHSMFHLCGYDHMNENDRIEMEEKQTAVLDRLGITREN